MTVVDNMNLDCIPSHKHKRQTRQDTKSQDKLDCKMLSRKSLLRQSPGGMGVPCSDKLPLVQLQTAGVSRLKLCMSIDSPSLEVGQGRASGCQALSAHW